MKNPKKRIKIFVIIVLFGIIISKCELPTPSYNPIGPGILYTPM